MGAPSGRRAYIDWMRGLSVLFMIEAHTFDAWTVLADRATPLYKFANFIGGLAAPLFLFLAGGPAGAHRIARWLADGCSLNVCTGGAPACLKA